MSVIHAPEETALTPRQLAAPALIVAALLGFIVRLWWLQVLMVDSLSEEAQRTATREIRTMAPRGQIVDREGRPVASVKSTWVVTAVPKMVKENPESLPYAAGLLGVPVEKLEEELKSAPFPSLPTDIYSKATLTQAMKIAEARSELPGYDVEMRALRQMVEPKAFTHIVGYVGKPNDKIIEELKAQGVEASDYAGRDGLERTYEKELMGEPGKQRLTVDAKSRPISRLEDKVPVPGSRLFLSVDADLQRTAMAAMGSNTGAVAAIDPRSGEILCFYSSPTYDVTLFDGGISAKDFAQLNDNPLLPLTRRPTSGKYSPGSTFKVVTALAAARAGKLDLNRRVYCNGGIMVGKKKVICHNHSAGMSMNFAEAFMRSCNSYFVKTALEVGAEEIHRAALDLGLGVKTGIDLPSESRGNIPDGLVVREYGGDRKWYLGDTANLGIGQGATLVTPMQMAQLAEIVANNGIAYKPHFVRSVQRYQDTGPKPVAPIETIKVDAPDGFWDLIKGAMRTVISSGTARKAQIRGVDWGGKTGSAEHSHGGKTHSWFIGVAPLDEPKIAIAVLAESAGHGGDVSAPVAAAVVSKWLHILSKEESRSKP